MKNDLELMNRIRASSNMIKRSGKPHGILPQGYGRILAYISDNDGLTQSELADLLDIRPQSLTRALSDLEKRGMVRRERSETDRRIVSLYITDKGTEAHEQIEEIRSKRAESLFSCYTEEEKETLISLLKKFSEASAQEKGGEA
ncbi:MAG: MarR family transcriptional regulator [Clostridia bacterium]|nr:MarR family transcriptional regulator [Clostridia bacterium]MBR6821557.1 MarR family transcriptional regulator [Clostridia bacterium]